MKHRGIGAILLAVPLSAAGVLSFGAKRAGAGVAPPYWDGAQGMGAILSEESPVEVEHEHLTLSLSQLPSVNFEDPQGFVNYDGKFTAEYTLHNGTSEAQTVSLVLPTGLLPSYVPWDAVTSARAPEKFRVTVDGKAAECDVRYTYNEGAYTAGLFNLDVGLDRLSSAEKKFYTSDLPVYIHTYAVQMGEEDRERANFSLSFEGSAKSRVFCSEHFNFAVNNGRGKLIHSFECADGLPMNFIVYVLGEDISDIKTGVFRYAEGNAQIVEDATVREVSEESSTFWALAQSLREIDGTGEKVSERDWENALIDQIESGLYAGSAGFVSRATPKELGGTLMQWYAYDVTIPAGERVISAVTAPIYPSVDSTFSQNVYRYTYLLSPAWRWEKFGGLTIDIDTPYFLSESSLDFEPREGGYTLNRDSLPLGELTFTLSEEEPTASGVDYSDGNDMSTALITAIVILCIVIAGAVTVVVLLTVQSRRRKRAREEEERRLMQARPQEGRIDLPDEEKRDEDKNEQ